MNLIRENKRTCSKLEANTMQASQKEKNDKEFTFEGVEFDDDYDKRK